MNRAVNRMEERTVLVRAVFLSLMLVQYSCQHDYKAGTISGGSSHSFSAASASASSYASSNSFSSSNSFGAKDLNNAGTPLGNLFNSVKVAANAQAGAQAGTNAAASAGAQAGAGAFGSGFGGKAFAGSKTFSISSGTHGLGVGGGIGIDNGGGNVENVGKYGSAAIKGGCGGSTCFGSGTLGIQSGLSASRIKTGSSIGGASSGGEAYGNLGSTGSYSSGRNDYNLSNRSGIDTGNIGSNFPGGGYTSGKGTDGSGTQSNGINGAIGLSGSPGCIDISGDCSHNIETSAKDGSYYNAGVRHENIGLANPGHQRCVGSSERCGGDVIEYSSNVKPLPSSPTFVTGSVPVINPIEGISGSFPACSGSDSGCNLSGIQQTPATGTGYSPDYLTKSSEPSLGTGTVYITKPATLLPELAFSKDGNFDAKPTISSSTLIPDSQTPELYGSLGFKVLKPTISFQKPFIDTSLIPDMAVHYSGAFPGPSFSIHHSIPVSSIPSKPSSAVGVGDGGTAAASGAHADIGANAPGDVFVGAKPESHYTGPFPGPSGSIHRSKPASATKPSIHDKPSTPSYTFMAGNVNAQAGATASTGSYFTGTFPGPPGSIYQSKPAIFVGAPETPSKPATSSISLTGPNANAQAGATASSATFDGPSIVSVHQNSQTTPTSFITPTTADYGSHYTGLFPGPAGNIHKSTAISSGGKAIGVISTITQQQPIASTVYTEKPIINIVPISPSGSYHDHTTTDKSLATTISTSEYFDEKVNPLDDRLEFHIASGEKNCANGICAPIANPAVSCEGELCKTSDKLPSEISTVEPFKDCSGSLCNSFVGAYAAGANSYGGNAGLDGNSFPSTICSGSNCNFPNQGLGKYKNTEDRTTGANANFANKIGSSTYTGTGCFGASCGSGSIGALLDGTRTGSGGNALARSGAAAGTRSSTDNTPPLAGCSGPSCDINWTRPGNNFIRNGGERCVGLKCDTSGTPSSAFSEASSGSFAGSYSNSNSRSDSYSPAGSKASSHSFAGSSSSSGSFGFPSGEFDGAGAQSGAYSTSFANAGSSASSGHY